MEEKLITQPHNCWGYDHNLWELFIPSTEVFDSFCISEDKTELFLISLARAIIYLYITKWYYDTYAHTNSGENYISQIKSDKILLILVILSIINIMYLVMVMIKRPHNTTPN